MAAWKILGKSVLGTSHRDSDIPCQDSCLTAEQATQGGPIVILLCADGAGSASHSDIGSALVCQTLMQSIVMHLDQGRSVEDIAKTVVVSWCDQVRSKLMDRAAELSLDVRQLACTLLAAIVGTTQSVYFQIGDGAIIILENNDYRLVFWPERGEYANTTFFITQDTFADALRYEVRTTTVDELAMISDGLQMVALDYASQQVHQGFFLPMFKTMRATNSVDELMGPLAEFLESPRLNERTDDDKTLILATRLNSPSTAGATTPDPESGHASRCG